MMKPSLPLALLLAFAAPVGFTEEHAAPTHEAATPAPQLQQPLTKAEQKQSDAVKAALQTWLAAVATRQVEQILPLYADDAVLLPTVAPAVHEEPAERQTYFEHFTAKENLMGKIDEEHVRLLGPDAAIDSGLYTFTYTKNGQTYSVPARYTFVFKKMGDTWKIVEHHSSKTPE